MSAAAIVDVERAVKDRYTGAATAPEPSLCCPVSYDPALLEAIPQEVLERDYGCGDPTRHVRPGETVLDLGSGAGKACFLASQVVGPTGRVIGVDLNDEMLALARKSAPEFARRIGYANVSFKKGRIQDLALDLERADRYLREHPVHTAEDLARLQAQLAELRKRPAVADDSVDVVISNCVLNLVNPQAKRHMFAEILRVLRPGGRAVISDIVSDQDVPERLQRDPELWSGCVSGAFREDLFPRAFEAAGFFGIAIVERQAEPWRTVEGIEFRSVTLVAYKGKDGPCIDRGHAALYRGPFREVVDDDGHVLRRGVRTPVCEKTFRILSQAPYREAFELIPPRAPVPTEHVPSPACDTGARRGSSETDGGGRPAATDPKPATCTPRNGAAGMNGTCC